MTPEQQDSLDKTVLAAIRDASKPLRFASLLGAPSISKAIASLPHDKDASRYLDRSLQRLRKRGSIEALRGGRWQVVLDT